MEGLQFTFGAITFVLFLLAWLLLPQSFREELLQFVLQQFFPRRKEASMKKQEGVFVARSKRTKVVKEYKNSSGVAFRRGDIVRLNGRTAFVTEDPMPALFLGRRITQGKIVSLLPDIKGYVQVEPRLGGYWTWHVDDLKKV
jgi:hypothetical protein